MGKGDEMESMQHMFRKMMEFMRTRNSNSFSPYSSNSHHGDSMMDKMRMMMKMMKMNNMMNSHDDYSSSSYSSDDAFDMFSDMFDTTHKMNNIDVQAMKRDIQKYTMPSEWFKNKYEYLLDTCYEMATNLPAEIAENSVVTGESFGTVKLGEVKMFTKCCEKAKTKLCMHQDIKNKVESNFGPMEDILQ